MHIRLAHRCRTALLALLVGPWAAANAEPPVAGLIVRLKASAPHEAAARPAAESARREAERWQRVLAVLGPEAPAATRRAVGRDQHRLDFGRPLGADEARRLAARLAERPEVAWAEPNTLEPLLQTAPPQVPPGDPMWPGQWWTLPNAGTNGNAPADRRRGVPGVLSAWQSGIAGATDGAAIAVLDTGITDHPELAGRLLPGHDFVADAAYANDDTGRDTDPHDNGDWIDERDQAKSYFAGCARAASSWHGTIVAGQIAAAANNAAGIAGLQWTGKVLPVRVAGKCGAAVSDIVDGMRWAAGLYVDGVPRNEHPARVVNISFGGTAACGMAYQQAVDELRILGVVVIAAAGNAGASVSRPANCQGVVGVAALNRDGFKTTYSSFGGELAASGIATVGGDNAAGAWGAALQDGGLLSTWNTGATFPGAPGYANVFGTSFAAPLVAGTAALMLGVNPRLGVDELVRGLRLSARPHVVSPWMAACSAGNPGRCLCSTATCGAGILDTEQALRFAAAPDSYVAPARQPEAIDTPELRDAAALGPDVAVSSGAPADGGGGALAPFWVLCLALAVAVLRRITAAPRTPRTAGPGPAA